VEAIRVAEGDLAGALLGPELASDFGQFGYTLAGRVVRDGVDPDVQEVLGNWSNTFDFSEAREQITNCVLHLRRRFDQPAGEDASVRFREFGPEVLQRRLARRSRLTVRQLREPSLPLLP
jgi:hypothetical protein